MTSPRVPEIAVRYHDAEELFAHVRGSQLFVPTIAPSAHGTALGESVLVDVSLDAAPPRAARVAGRVVGKRGSSPDRPAGVTVALDGRALTLLAGLAGQGNPAVQRKGRRVRAKIEVECSFDGATAKGTVEDISPGGLAIRSSLVRPRGSVVSLKVSRGLFRRPISVSGRVVWTRLGGVRAMGVELFDDEANRGLAELLERLPNHAA